jgi:GNAT superfamily N-acetyltransferase
VKNESCRIFETNKLNEISKKEIYKLWNNEYPINLNYHTVADFDRYLLNLINPAHYLLKNETGNTVGWACTFTRDNEVWFAIIINEHYKNKGYGKMLLNLLKTKEITLNGWVIDHNDYIKENGTSYDSPLAFYEKNEFKVISEIRLELEILSAVKIKWSK